MTDDFNPSEWITTSEAADLTGYSQGHIRLLIKRQSLPAQKRGGIWFLRKNAILAYAREMQQLGTDKHDPWRTGSRSRREDAD